jgi:hypothetical protein
VRGGFCDTCDATAAAIGGAPLPPGWRLEIRERARTAFRRDDLYWRAPANGRGGGGGGGTPADGNAKQGAIRSRAAFLAIVGDDVDGDDDHDHDGERDELGVA